MLLGMEYLILCGEEAIMKGKQLFKSFRSLCKYGFYRYSIGDDEWGRTNRISVAPFTLIHYAFLVFRFTIFALTLDAFWCS